MKKLILIASFVFLASNSYAGLTGLGIGIHGGIISGYDNPVLESSILSQYTGFDFPDQMTNIGLHINIGTLRIIEFDVSADYAWKKQEVVSGVDLKFSDFSASGSVRKSIPLAVLKPYAGAGLGIHAMAYSLEIEGLPPVILPDNEAKIGFHFKVGLELNIPIFPITPMVEWKYNVIQTTGESSKYNSINLGLTLDLP